MAIIQMNFLSKTLMRQVPLNVILPVDKLTFPGMPEREDKPYKTLYLLHGVFGNYTDWLVGTNIAKFAEEHDLVVVMPSGDNAFYVDQEKGHNFYGEFIGKELVDITRKMFPLSHKREDTFIGGLSMGGYGAMRNGLKYSETFGAIVSLSGALIIDDMPERTNDVPYWLGGRDYAEACFGDLDKVIDSDKNPKWLIKDILANKKPMPKIYMACGTEDSLFPANENFHEFLKAQNVEVTFDKGPGIHDWNFWGTYIERAINWLPTEKSGLGINSGNIGK